jgi:transposase-like protein
MSRTRRHFTAEQKAEAVRRHLVGQAAISDLAESLQVQPSQIHLWIKQVLDQAERAFGRSDGRRRSERAKDRRIEQLETKLAQKHEVISELMEENIKAKSQWGALKGRWVPHDTRDQIVDYIGF